METKKYFFQPEKKVVKQGFFLEDESGSVVYEAKVLKQPLFGAAEVDFVNHVRGTTETHRVGKTVTTETSGMLPIYTRKSRFKFDGTNIWDYLHDAGVRIDSHMAGDKIGMVYSVSLKGNEIATIASAAPAGGISVLTSRFNFDIMTSEENLDTAFLVAYSIAKTEQTFYS